MTVVGRGESERAVASRSFCKEGGSFESFPALDCCKTDAKLGFHCLIKGKPGLRINRVRGLPLLN
jgi:hypothetical protein